MIIHQRRKDMASKNQDELCCNRLCQPAVSFLLAKETAPELSSHLCNPVHSTLFFFLFFFSIALWISILVNGKVEEACVADGYWAET